MYHMQILMNVMKIPAYVSTNVTTQKAITLVVAMKDMS